MDSASALARIVEHIDKHSYYILPHKFYCHEDTTIRIKVTLWKTDPVDDMFAFGITVHSRGNVEHQMFNISVPVAKITEVFIQEQIERIQRILSRPLRPLCGTLGPNKTSMMEAVGMDKKALGIEECCVCAKETALKTMVCSHNVCLSCLTKVERCPMCRNEDVTCACCAHTAFESDNEDETDDDFARV